MQVTGGKWIEEKAQWEPSGIDEAKTMITFLQQTLVNKDNRILLLMDDNDYLLQRISQLKTLLKQIGIKVA